MAATSGRARSGAAHGAAGRDPATPPSSRAARAGSDRRGPERWWGELLSARPVRRRPTHCVSIDGLSYQSKIGAAGSGAGSIRSARRPCLQRRFVRGARALVTVLLLLAAAACERDRAPLPRTLPLRLADNTSYSPCRVVAESDARPDGRFAKRLPQDCRATSAAAGEEHPLHRFADVEPADAITRVALTTWAAQDDKTLQRAAETLAAGPPSNAPAQLVARAAVSSALSAASGSPEPAIEALELLEHARSQQAPGDLRLSRALAFNRAVVLTDVALCHLAVEAFALASAVETDESWRGEIAQRTKDLPCGTDVPPASTLDGKIDAALDGELASAAAALGTLGQRQAIGRLAALGAELKAAGEPLVANIAAELADDRTAPALRRAVADAAAGRSAFLALDFDRSLRLFRQSCGVLERHGSAAAGWCRYWLLATRLYYGDLREVGAELAALRAVSASPYLRGRAAWSEGLAAFRQGALGSAHDLFAIAAGELSAVGLSRSHAAVEVMRAEVLSALGALQEAAQVRRAALAQLQSEEPHFALVNGLIDGANDAHAMGFTRAASAYLAEAALLAGRQHNTVAQTEIRLLQGELELGGADRGAGRRARPDAQARARKHFLAARTLAVNLSGEVARERNTAVAELGLAESGDPAFAAPAALLALADFFAVKGPRSGELRALTRLVEAAENDGDAALAGRVRGRAGALIAEQRATIRGLSRDARFLAYQRAFFDRMIAAALRRGDGWGALALVADASPGPAAVEATAVATSIDGRLLLVYRFVDDQLVWWSVRRDLLRHDTLGDAQTARELIAGLRSARGRPTEKQLEAGYHLLLGAPLQGAKPGEPLVIVADDELAAIPFAALRESGSGVRLIEKHPLSLAMSPRLSPRTFATPSEPGPFRATIVGDPAFDRSRLGWLGRLPGALSEARAVAQVYGPAADLLVGEEATAGAVRSSASGAAVLHVAAHALSGGAGQTVALALAAEPGSGRSGLSSGEELAPTGGSADLVVLSACGTLDARGSDGLIGLAGPFIAAGASAVLGTLWPVDDRQMAGWMVDFHRLVADGVSASAALREVQSRAAKTGPCCSWAALALVGDATLPAQPHSSPGAAGSSVRETN